MVAEIESPIKRVGLSQNEIFVHILPKISPGRGRKYKEGAVAKLNLRAYYLKKISVGGGQKIPL
jgi:hypothetical protein